MFLKRENKENSLISINESQDKNLSIDTDLSDVGLCSFNINEYHFNIILCHLFKKNYKSANDNLKFLKESLPKKYYDQIHILNYIINKLFGNEKEGK